jgi:starch synthase (maltosyl-transferring)
MAVPHVSTRDSTKQACNGTQRQTMSLPGAGRLTRVVIDEVRPVVDNGRRPAKAAVGQQLRVEARAFADGHDVVRCELRYRSADDAKWRSMSMADIGNDRWRAAWLIETTGWHRFVIRAAVDPFETWRRDLRIRHSAGQDVGPDLAVGAALLEEAAARAKKRDAKQLLEVAHVLTLGPRGLEQAMDGSGWDEASAGAVVFSDRLGDLMATCADATTSTSSATFSVFADPPLARCSAWYEMFPRSASRDPARHGTLDDVRRRLDDIERMGFDVLYLPPIHPIGRTGRKGADGSPHATSGDPGSPWAIGAAEGGHRDIHPELGTLDDFSKLLSEARSRHIAIALDLAFQASPDHPWVAEHPEWFRHRPDGTIRHAENPPKMYEDIYPLDFESAAWPDLWRELLDVVLLWIERGVTVFRVDNPHTKPFAFWEWLICSVKERHPEVLFLAEAFTRPGVMQELAKLGFSQSYTYFTWRISKWDLETYLHELTEGEMADYFRPNFWPNTPDILSEELQNGGRAAFVARLVLAATLSPNYGLYGPAFELQEHVPRTTGSEEYRRSEKYEIRAWDLDRPDSLTDLIGTVNAARRMHPALQHQEGLRFHRAENDQIIVYSRRYVPTTSDVSSDLVVVVVNLDHDHEQSAWVELDLEAIGLDPARPIVMHDVLRDAHYQWQGPRNFVILDPAILPAHVFAVTQHSTPMAGS